MIVLSVTDCPPALRGDLTRWLLEIDTGVYVGRVNQRVRERLWERVVANLKSGRAVLVFTARNEQGLDFRVHNAAWEPIDFDGLKLMLRPSAPKTQTMNAPDEKLKPGYSNAAKMLVAKRVSKARAKASGFPADYIVIDLETTGLKPSEDRIIEIGAIRYSLGEEADVFHALVQPLAPLPKVVQNLTGLTDDVLKENGQDLESVLQGFVSFLGDWPIVSHNIAFDLEFLLHACGLAGITFPPNRRIDTLSLARHSIRGLADYKLTSLLAHFNQPTDQLHRSLADCRATAFVLDKLIEIRGSNK